MFQPSQIGGLSDFAGPSTDMAMDLYHSIPILSYNDNFCREMNIDLRAILM